MFKKKLNQQIHFNCAVTGTFSCGLPTVDREIFTLKIIVGVDKFS